jgi:hypothetical protein
MNKPFVYAMTDGQYIKIGVSVRPNKRKSNLSTGNAKKLILLGYFPGGFELESELHKRFKKVRSNGEWFEATSDIVEYLNEQIQDKFIIVDDNNVLQFYPRISI